MFANLFILNRPEEFYIEKCVERESSGKARLKILWANESLSTEGNLAA